MTLSHRVPGLKTFGYGSRALRRSGMGVRHVGVDVGAARAEVDVIYIYSS